MCCETYHVLLKDVSERSNNFTTITLWEGCCFKRISKTTEDDIAKNYVLPANPINSIFHQQSVVFLIRQSECVQRIHTNRKWKKESKRTLLLTNVIIVRDVIRALLLCSIFIWSSLFFFCPFLSCVLITKFSARAVRCFNFFSTEISLFRTFWENQGTKKKSCIKVDLCLNQRVNQHICFEIWWLWRPWYMISITFIKPFSDLSCPVWKHLHSLLLLHSFIQVFLFNCCPSVCGNMSCMVYIPLKSLWKCWLNHQKGRCSISPQIYKSTTDLNRARAKDFWVGEKNDKGTKELTHGRRLKTGQQIRFW